MRSMAWLEMSVASSNSAPKTMYSRVAATMSPSIVAAASATGFICHTSTATTTADTYPTGMAYFAGQRKPASNIPTTTIGARAKKLSAARLSVIVQLLCLGLGS